MRRFDRWNLLGAAVVTALALSSCGSEDTRPAGGASPRADVALTAFSQQIHDALPPEIRQAGVLRTVSIVFPPYARFGDDGSTLEGLNVDMVHQLESILGIKVTFETVPTVADLNAGFTSKRFDVSLAPTSDLPATEESYDFADWLAEYVVFLVKKDNPKGVESLETACGTTVATLQGGTAEQVLKKASSNCAQLGKPPVTINTFADQNTAVLAVQSGRADSAFSSQIPLTYFAKTDDDLKLTGLNQLNGFPKFWVGAYAPKGSPLVRTMLDSFNAMKQSGAYLALLKSYGIEANAIDTFGINLATTGPRQ